MDLYQQQIVSKCKMEFLKMGAKRQHVDIQDKALLTGRIIELMGLYELGYSKELHQLLKDMIEFGERHNLVLAGQRLHFDELNRRYKVPVHEKQVLWKAEFTK